MILWSTTVVFLWFFHGIYEDFTLLRCICSRFRHLKYFGQIWFLIPSLKWDFLKVQVLRFINPSCTFGGFGINSHRETFFLRFYAVIWVHFGSQRPDLQKSGFISHHFDGINFGYEWLNGLFRLDLWINQSWIRINWVFWADYYGFVIDASVAIRLHPSSSQHNLQSKESKRFLGLLRLQMCTGSTGRFLVPTLEIQGSSRDVISADSGNSGDLMGDVEIQAVSDEDVEMQAASDAIFGAGVHTILEPILEEGMRVNRWSDWVLRPTGICCFDLSLEELVSALDLRIPWNWLLLLRISWENYCRITIVFHLSDRLQLFKSQNILEAKERKGMLWDVLRLQWCLESGESLPVSILVTLGIWRDTLLSLFGELWGKRDRRNLKIFLIQHQIRRLQPLGPIFGIDLDFTLKGYDSLIIGLSWQLWLYKKVARATSQLVSSSLFSVSSFSLRFSGSFTDLCEQFFLGFFTVSVLVEMSRSSMLGKEAVGIRHVLDLFLYFCLRYKVCIGFLRGQWKLHKPWLVLYFLLLLSQLVEHGKIGSLVISIQDPDQGRNYLNIRFNLSFLRLEKADLGGQQPLLSKVFL